MENDFVASVIRKLNVKMLSISLLGYLVVLLGLIVGGRYLYNFILGPFPLEQAGLLSVVDANANLKYFVTVQGNDHADTGYAYINRSSSGKETTEAYYHVLLIRDRLLMVKSTQPEIANTMTGALRPMPADVQKEVVAELEGQVPEVKDAFLPVMLDAGNFRASGLFGLATGALVGLFSTIGALLAIYRMINPNAHPAMKALERFGPLEAVTGEIDMEVASAHEQVGKKVHFTSRWLVSTKNGLTAAPYRDILWCYKQVTQHRTNGIPTGKTYMAHVFDRFGKDLSITGKEAEVNQVLENVVRFAPGVVAGYSDDLSRIWRQDRAQFAGAVDARRK